MDPNVSDPAGVACLDDLEPRSILDAPMTRRRGLGFIGAGASALIAGLASACGIIRFARCDLGAPCCFLATCIECDWQGSKDQYTCEEGYRPTYWTCIDDNGVSVVCGECSWAEATSCFQGPFKCSIWY